MAWIITGIISVVLNGIMFLIKDQIPILFDIAFRPGNYSHTLNAIIQPITETFYGIGISLIILKFLKKGFEIYVLWTDGDPDADPFGYLVNFIKAIVTAICFPFVYNFFVDIVSGVTNDLIKAISTASDFFQQPEQWASRVLTFGVGPALATLIFIIVFLVLLFKIYMRAVELIILRAGVPVACVGLLDNDKGVFRSYVNQFVKAFITTVVQIVLARLGLALFMTADFANDAVNNIIYGISCMVLAVTAPKILNEFLLPSGGGGMSNMAFQATYLASNVKRFIK